MKRTILYLVTAILVFAGGCKQKPSAPGALRLISASPSSFDNSQDVTLTIKGEGLTKDTDFFIQSNLLSVVSVKPNEAKVVVPGGFLPATYGLMASRPDGQRSTLYPAFTITQGDEPQTNPREHPRSFVEGVVIDYETKQPIQGANISTQGLVATSDRSGYFLLWGVPPGRASIRIEAEGYEPVYRFAEVPEGTQTVTVKLAELEPMDTNVTVIGPKGGTHHAKNGAYLVVPEGALDEDVPIRFTHLRGPNTLPELAEDGYYLAFAHLEPAGLVFKKPATLYLPLPDGVVVDPGTDINIFYFDARQGRWVDDVTSGKIAKMEGRFYLVYQINHFTWIGGTWYPDEVRGCVVIGPDRLPARGAVTNFGVSDGNGHVRGSTTQSMVGYDLKLTVSFQGETYESPPVHYSGSGPVVFPGCVHLPLVKDTWDSYDPLPFPDLDFHANDAQACPSDEQSSMHSGGQAASRYSVSLLGSTYYSGLTPTKGQIASVAARSNPELFAAIEPSSIEVRVNGKSISDNAWSNHLVSNGDGVEEYRELVWGIDQRALDASTGDSDHIEISYTTRGGKTYSHEAELYLPDEYVAAPMLLFPVRTDEDAWLGIDSTLLDELPAVSFANGTVVVVYEEGQPIHGLDLLLPVYAVDFGMEGYSIAPVHAPSVYLTYGAENERVSASGPMRNGVALLPITIDTDDPENYEFHFTLLQYEETGGGGGVAPQQVNAAAQAVTGVYVAAGTVLAPEVVLPALAAGYGAYLLQQQFPGLADSFVRALQGRPNDIDQLIDQMYASGDLVADPVDEPDSVCWDQTNALEYATNTHAGEPVAYAPNTDTADYLERCTPKPEFRSGQRPAQDHFVYDQRIPAEQRAIKNQASNAITKRWLKEMEFVCRFGIGTRSWESPEIKALQDAARAYAGAPSHTQGVKRAFDVLRERGLYGQNGKYVGHHINGKACHQADAGNVNNIELIERADHAFCHGGDYRQCSSGETLKSFDEIADILKGYANGVDRIADCPTFNY
ncbi:carboxypeptidase regulatory-like domain-containing protein [Deinococcota bacterium DY0809b]